MAKRSDFERIEKDYYPTIDLRAGKKLEEHLNPQEIIRYAEPCYGNGHLDKNLREASSKFICHQHGDVISGKDLFDWTERDVDGCSLIITNPPWSRGILHPAIVHLSRLLDTWLLFDSSWAYTKQAKPFIKNLCTEIVAVGRLKWIEGTSMSGKDDCSWYKFSKNKNEQTKFYV